MNPVQAVPSVKLVLVQPQDEAKPVTTVANLSQQRVEQFLDLKELAARTRKSYAQQLRLFSDWVDKDWQSVNLNRVVAF